ncbi:Putative tRNA pseudouridine synthase Pus10 [Chamberlinius hualienensis]
MSSYFWDKIDGNVEPIIIYKTLNEIGCCNKCILRFIGVKNIYVYATDSSVEQMVNDTFLISSDVDETTPRKKPKLLGCVACLGILSELCDQTTVNHIVSQVESAGNESETFLLSVVTPICLQLRQFSVLLHLKEKFPDVYKLIKLDDIPLVKEVWKWSMGSLVENQLQMKFSIESPLDIIIAFDYVDDITECNELENIIKCEKPKWKKNRQWSRASIATFLTNEKADQLKHPPLHPDNCCKIQHVTATHSAIYLAGRYNKYSRTLSQTPWIIDGVKHAETSVQEQICEYIQPWMKPDEIVFSASGREDVDVRALGRGRPFILQVVNPKHTKINQQEVKQIAQLINTNCTDIAVLDLQVVSKADTSKLKEGEEEKKKSYSAVCYSVEPLTVEDMQKLSQITDLVLYQKSPIRVLHRRSAAIREKMIHSMSAKIIDQHHFRMQLWTQAGTYVKEFVHGDFGRTKPNVSSLLQKTVDIVELDVESIDLDWPPQLD